MSEKILLVLSRAPPFEWDKPVFIAAGITLTLRQVMDEISRGSALGVELAEKIGRVINGASIKEVLSEDELWALTIERYKWYVSNLPGYETVRIHVLGTGSFSILDVIDMLENRKEGYRRFVDAEAGYLNWLYRR